MTMASQARRTRRVTRRLGRPAKHDQLIIDLAAAFERARGLSERKSIDMALSWIEGEVVSPSKTPRGTRSRSGQVIGHELRRTNTTYAGRASTIRHKLNAGAKARPEIAFVFVLLLESKDVVTFRKYVRTLISMPDADVRAVAARLLGVAP